MHLTQYILQVLVRDSSIEHPVTQSHVVREVHKLMKVKYSDEEMPKRKAIETNLVDLVDHSVSKEAYKAYCNGEKLDGELIDEKLHERSPGIYCIVKENGEKERREGYWIENTLSEDELNYVIDSVLYSKILSHERVESMIKRLIASSSKELEKSVGYFENMKKQIHMSEIDTLDNVRIIRNAIRREKKIEYVLNAYKWRFNSTTRENEVALEPCRANKYLCSPYDVIYNNGRYYMLAANASQEKHGGYYFVRIDLMTDIIVTSKRALTKRNAHMHDTDDLFKHRIQNPHIYSGEITRVKLRIDRSIMQQIVDSFGDEFVVNKVKLGENSVEEKYLDITVKVNKGAFLFWILQYSQHVEVLEPDSYRNEVKDIINKIAEKYNQRESQ